MYTPHVLYSHVLCMCVCVCSARPSAGACLQEVWLHTGLIGLNGVGKVVDLSRLKGHLERTTV